MGAEWGSGGTWRLGADSGSGVDGDLGCGVGVRRGLGGWVQGGPGGAGKLGWRVGVRMGQGDRVRGADGGPEGMATLGAGWGQEGTWRLGPDSGSGEDGELGAGWGSGGDLEVGCRFRVSRGRGDEVRGWGSGGDGEMGCGVWARRGRGVWGQRVQPTPGKGRTVAAEQRRRWLRGGQVAACAEVGGCSPSHVPGTRRERGAWTQEGQKSSGRGGRLGKGGSGPSSPARLRGSPPPPGPHRSGPRRLLSEA